MRERPTIRPYLPGILSLLSVLCIYIWLQLPLGQSMASLERIASLLVFPVILASFIHGRLIGLGIAFLASMAWGSLILGRDVPFQSTEAHRILFNILMTNILALTMSFLSDRTKDSNTRYRRLFNNMPAGIYITTRDGRILEANPALASILGHASRNDLLQTNITDFYLSQKDREECLRIVEESNGREECEVPLRRVDGTLIWVRIKAHVIDHPSETVPCYEGIIEDITEGRDLRKRLEEAHRVTADILESLPDPTFVVDEDKKVIAWNRALEELSGVSKEDILGRGDQAYSEPFYGFARPALLDCLWMEDEELEKSYDFVERHGEKLIAEVFVPSFNNGRGAHLWAAASPLRDTEGRIIGAIETIRDVTRRKEVENDLAMLNRELETLVEERTVDLTAKARELEAANRRLRELDQLKSSFLNTVSHDIRTPLTSILGYAKLMNRDLDRHLLPAVRDDVSAGKLARIQDNIGIIVSEGERLTRLINDFLDLSKIESGNMEWHDREVHLHDCVDKAMASLRGSLGDDTVMENLELKVDVAPGLPPLYADPDRMVQLLSNLLTNAVKFTMEGGVTLTADREGDMIRIQVADTGVGIPLDQQERIFDRFHQVDTDDTLDGRPKGTGLGLAICREIVDYYQGIIGVRSTPGVGTTFTVFLQPMGGERNTSS